jgi:hypothetical protein
MPVVPSKTVAADEPWPAPDVTRAARGRFLHRHNARVIEQDDLLVVEFVDARPWYTVALEEAEAERRQALPRLHSFILCGVSIGTSALTVARLLHWI